jgi:hypothetical protein
MQLTIAALFRLTPINLLIAAIIIGVVALFIATLLRTRKF